MSKFLYYFCFFGGILITLLGVVILLIKDDTGENPHTLSLVTMILVFVVGFSLIFYIVRNKGIS